jgi:TRAP transporter TAXI family solute receptor
MPNTLKPLVLALPAILLAGGVRAQEDPDTLVLFTASPTGSYQTVGRAIAQVIEEAIPSVQVELGYSSGSVENIIALATGDADLAIAQSDIAFRATRGDAPFEGRDFGSIEAIMGLHPEEVLVIGRTALGLGAAPSIPAGSRVLVGEAGSGTLLNARNVLGAMGLGMELVDTVMRVPRTNLHLLATDSIDFLFLTAGVSQDFVDEVEANGGSILTLGDDLVRLLQQSQPYYRATTLDVNGRAVRTVQIRAVLLATDRLSDEFAGRITRALNEGLSTIRASHPRALEILPGTVTESVSVHWHPGAARYYCDVGLRGCASHLPLALALAGVIALAFLGLSFSRTLREALLRVAPRLAEKLVGPQGVTDRYRYVLVPLLIGLLLCAGAFVVQTSEERFARENGTTSDFEDIGLNRNLVWMVASTASGVDDGRSPQSPVGRLTSTLMGWIGIGGLLLLGGMVVSDRIVRRDKVTDHVDTAKLEGHVIVCGWNERAAQLIRSLTSADVSGRRQMVVVVAELASDPVESFYLRKDYVRFVPGTPTELAVLRAAGLDRADTVIVLADAESEDPDARTVLTVLQVEKHAYRLREQGVRDREIHSIAEILNPDKKSVLESVHTDLIVCPQEFNEKLLLQAVLNPGTARFLRQILTVEEENQLVEVPVRGREDPPLVGKTFDEALVDCRGHSLLLVAINRGGAPGARDERRVDGSEVPPDGGARRLITNPYREEEREYRIQVGDSLLFLAEGTRPLERIFGASDRWGRALKS